MLSVGAINGRNIWKTDLNATLDWLEPLAKQLGDRLWLAPSCSLLHVPVDLASEEKLDAEIRSWLAFALQKLDELKVLATALNEGRDKVAEALAANAAAIHSRRQSPRVNNPAVKAAIARIDAQLGNRAVSLSAARAEAVGTPEPAGVPDDDDRLVPADRRNPPGPQPVQGGRAG